MRLSSSCASVGQPRAERENPQRRGGFHRQREVAGEVGIAAGGAPGNDDLLLGGQEGVGAVEIGAGGGEIVDELALARRPVAAAGQVNERARAGDGGERGEQRHAGRAVGCGHAVEIGKVEGAGDGGAGGARGECGYQDGLAPLAGVSRRVRSGWNAAKAAPQIHASGPVSSRCPARSLGPRPPPNQFNVTSPETIENSVNHKKNASAPAGGRRSRLVRDKAAARRARNRLK